MDHTLLPADQKKTLLHEYRVRAAIVALFVIAGALLIAVAGEVPSFLKVYTDMTAAHAAIADINDKKAVNGTASIEKILASDKTLVTLFMSNTDKIRMSSVIDALLGLRQNIRLTSIALTRTPKAVGIVVQGVAPTRESLLAYRDRLQSSVAGGPIDVPIGALTKSTDVQFSLQFNQPIK